MEYTYKVVLVEPENHYMELEYYRDGFDPVLVGARIPMNEQTLDQIAGIYAPVAVWNAPTDVYHVPEVNDTGAYSPPVPTWQDKINRKLAEINYAYELASNAIIGEYPPTERLTWTTQEAEARAWTKDNDAPTPWIDILCSQREPEWNELSPQDQQTYREEMIGKILAKADGFKQASATLTGIRQRLEDAIGAVTEDDDETLNAIHWS